ncbi:ABC transporter permease [Paludibacter sp.]
MDILQEIWSGLKHNKLRTVLTGLSVSWGIFILIILLGAGNGLKNGVTSNFSDRATNSVQLTAWITSKPFKGYKEGRGVNFGNKEMNTLTDNVKEVTDFTPILDRYNMTISYKNEFGTYTVKGIMPVYKEISHLKFETDGGRFINQADLDENRKVIVLDKKIKEEIFKNESAIGKYVKVNNIMFQVIGVNSKKENWGGGNSYIPFTTAQLTYNPGRRFNFVAMSVDGLDTKEANEKFDESLRSKLSQTMLFDPTDTQALWVWNSMESYLQTMKIFNGIHLFVLIIGIFTLIAGVVGVSNIMLVTVKERTREIGIRKAIGAPPYQILFSIIIESILITATFGYIGMIAGIGVTEFVNIILEQAASADSSGMSIFKNPTVNLNYVYFSTLIMIVGGVIAGYMPARRAVKIKPIEAMRNEK